MVRREDKPRRGYEKFSDEARKHLEAAYLDKPKRVSGEYYDNLALEIGSIGEKVKVKVDS